MKPVRTKQTVQAQAQSARDSNLIGSRGTRDWIGTGCWCRAQVTFFFFFFFLSSLRFRGTFQGGKHRAGRASTVYYATEMPTTLERVGCYDQDREPKQKRGDAC